MGINPTPTNYKSFTFDGKSSREFGVYTTGEGVFNAPERAVEMISIPARNGDYALDLGHFENIEVKYRCGIVTDNETDFAEAVSDFRNWLCSRRGYCRITDEYNPDEYRMGLFKSVIEVDHDGLETGEFDVTFDCKPQRWLTSGEAAVTIGEWGETETVSGEVVEIEATEADAVKSLVADIVPIQSGSGTPSPDNVRPISGHTEVDVYVSGVNLITSDNTEDGSINASGVEGATTGFKRTKLVPVDGTIAVNFAVGTGYTVRLHGYDSSGTWVSQIKYYYNVEADHDVVSIPSGISYVRLSFPTIATDVAIENATTYTTALGRTVYGGTLDLISGVLTVTHGIVDMGTLTYGKTSSPTSGGVYRFYSAGLNTVIKIPSATSVVPNMLCSAYKTTKFDDSTASVTGVSINALGSVFVTDSVLSSGTATDAKTALNGVQLVYELATPQTYQLTAQQIELLLGTNNIWADSGDVTLEYGQNPSVVINPTLFDSSPLLEVEGYGTIDLGGQIVIIEDVAIGSTLLASQQTATVSTHSVSLDMTKMENGDSFVVDCGIVGTFELSSSGSLVNIGSPSVTNCTATKTQFGTKSMRITVSATETFAYGTSASLTGSAICATGVKLPDSSVDSGQTKVTFTIAYDGDSTITYTFGSTETLQASTFTKTKQLTSSDIYGDSTRSALGNPLYIDLDIGEAYNLDYVEPVSVNNAVNLGSDLPTLPPGATTVNYDNTITDLKIAPRWWKV